MSPIRILYCIDSLARGGTELQLKEMIERMDKRKYAPYLLTIRPTDADLAPVGCKLLEWNVSSLLSVDGLKSVRKLSKFLQEENIEIVQTFFQDSTIFAGVAAKIAGVPVRIASCRDMAFWHTASQGLAMRAVYKLMTGYICNASIVRDRFVTRYRIKASKAYVLRNGVDVESLPYKPPADTVADIGIVGNMTREVKRIDLFIDAAALVAKDYPDIHWHVIGDGHLRSGLEKRATRLGIRDKVIFAGRVDEIPKYLERLQIGVNCSDSEGLSNAIIEYMFKGVASIVTDVGGNPELILDRQTGLLVPPGDVQSLSSAMKELIENKQLRNHIAVSARRHVENSYAWKNCLSEHDKIYMTQLAR